MYQNSQTDESIRLATGGCILFTVILLILFLVDIFDVTGLEPTNIMNTQPFSQTDNIIELCREYLYVRCI